LPAYVVGVLVAGTNVAWASSFVFTPLNAAGAALATPEAISASDQVVGITYNGNGDRVGFSWAANKLTVVNGSLELSAINDNGIAVGPPWLNEKSYYVSYDISTGVLSEVPVNLGLHGKQVVYATGINAAGEVIGLTDGGKYTGFIVVDGQASKLLPPKQKESFPVSVNRKGDVVIDYHGDLAQFNSFLYRNGHFSNVAVPGAATTTAEFITDSGVIGGSFTVGDSTSGFVRTGGTYAIYSPAGAASSTVSGVGPSGQVYGTFVDAGGNTHGFENVRGTYYQIDVPNSTFTNILAVGKSGAIIGFYFTAQGAEVGYIGKCNRKDVCTQ
jgi:hypothetical protein